MAMRSDRSRPCTYCPAPGADVCVRAQPYEAGGAHIYAHRSCAAKRKVKPLYVFTDEGRGAR